MARWQIEIPTVTEDGQPGVQVFSYDATYTGARDQVLIDVQSPDAVRHRRGARVDLTALTVRPYEPTATF
jgi:hypothetical protein